MKKNRPYIFTILLVGLVSYQASAVIEIDSYQNISAAGACDGSIDITATGTAGPFTFKWSDDSTITTQNRVNLCEGFYTVIVKNAYGCERTLIQYIARPLNMQTDLTYTRGCGSGTITLTLLGGYGPYTITWSDNIGTQSSSHIITRSNLSAGTYSATVTDYSGQTVTMPKAYVVTAPSYSLDITGVTQSACDGPTGAIDITVNSGHQPYTYQWQHGSSFQDLQNMSGGSYQVTVTDANGCQGVENFTIPSSNITINSTIQSACAQLNDGSLHVYATGGNPPYSYTWTFNGDTLDTSQLIEDLPPNRTFTIDVVDAAGCQVIESYLLPEEPEITAIDANNCVYVTKCRSYEEPQGAPQWDLSKPENWDKDNCEVTAFCSLTGQNETSSGRIIDVFSRPVIPSNMDCMIDSDIYCREHEVCEIYIPSEQEYKEHVIKGPIQFGTQHLAFTGNAPSWGIGPRSCTHKGNNAYLVELWCTNFMTPNNFLRFKCKDCTNIGGGTYPGGPIPDPPCYDSNGNLIPCNEMTPVITNVYPNPFYESFQIQFFSPTNDVDVTVMNALGQYIYNEKLEPQFGENVIRVDLDENLPVGMYFVTLQSSNGMKVTHRIVHQSRY